jgi:hypothetical protein
MGARKGQNNFQPAQTKRIESSSRLISHALRSIRKGILFKEVNSLLVYVARETKLHRTTIRRNPEYMRLLLDHFGNQAGAVGLVKDEDATAATLRAKLIACKTRVKSLEMNLERRDIREEVRLSGASSDQDDKREISDISFANTAMALLVLLERLTEKDLGIALDLSKKQIVDITEVGAKRVIVGPTRTRWFFEWLSLNQTAANYSKQLVAKSRGRSP